MYITHRVSVYSGIWRRSSNNKKNIKRATAFRSRDLRYYRYNYIDVFIILLYFLSISHSTVYVTYYYNKHSFAVENREIPNVAAAITICSFVPTRILFFFSLFSVRSSRPAVGGLSCFVNIIGGTFFTFMGRIGSFSCSRRPLDSRPDSLNRLFYIYYYIFVLHTHTRHDYIQWRRH